MERLRWEASTRGLVFPEPLRVPWCSVGGAFAASPDVVLGRLPGVRRTALRLRGNVTTLADTVARLPARQVVITGAAGSGKTSAAVLLALRVAREAVRGTGAAGANARGFQARASDHIDDFSNIIGDIIAGTRTFEWLAVTFASMHEERLRDQILAMLRNVYGEVTGETFSKRGKTDIYLPWQGDGAVFLAECTWWTGPKPFAEHDLPQLLDRYVVWRDTHAAMVLFIRNKDVTTVVDSAQQIIRDHPRYLRDADPVSSAPVFVLHKDGAPDRELKLALVTAAIHQ